VTLDGSEGPTTTPGISDVTRDTTVSR